jgi:L-asparaginase
MHTSSVETFNSGDFGFIGYADNDRVIFYRYPIRRQHIAFVGDKGDLLTLDAMLGMVTSMSARSAPRSAG